MTLLLSYDIEAASVGEGLAPVKNAGEKYSDALTPDSTVQALEILTEIHSKYEIPLTLFCTGKTLLQSPQALIDIKNNLGKLVDIQQHTYSHVIFKDVVYESTPGEKNFYEAPPFELLDAEVRYASDVLKKILNIDCKGIRTPYCYYQGLRGETKILSMLEQYGIEYVSSFGRNKEGSHPTPWINPYTYADEGFPNLVELPAQNWFDCLWYDLNGWNNQNEYKKLIKSNIEYIHSNDLVWNMIFHDWSIVKAQERTSKVIEDLIIFGKSINENFYSNYDYSKIVLKKA